VDNDTIFYILGIGLVLAALTVAFVGVRFDRFPASRGLLIGGTLVFAALVVATTTFAWRNAEDEQQARGDELAAEQQQNLEEGNQAEAQEEGATTTTTAATTTAAADGAQVFDQEGCGGCHTLSDAGSTGTVGPVLDDALKGKDAKFVETSIVDPNADIERGFPPNTMPQSYGEELSPDELNALVSYLVEATNAKG
jgi:mono/diheme cytochrome c family protein